MGCKKNKMTFLHDRKYKKINTKYDKLWLKK